MPPNFEEVDGAYSFWVLRQCVRPSVRPSRTVHARGLKFHIWIPHEKIFEARFSCQLSPFLKLCPSEKIRMKSCQQDFFYLIFPEL